jgi:hypothetical protein
MTTLQNFSAYCDVIGMLAQIEAVITSTHINAVIGKTLRLRRATIELP